MQPPARPPGSTLARALSGLALVGALSIGGFAGQAEAASHDLAVRLRGAPTKVGQAAVLSVSVLNLGSATVTSTDAVTAVVVLPSGFIPPQAGGMFPPAWACVVHGQQVTCTYAYGPPVAGRTLLPEISLFVKPTQPGPSNTCAAVSMTSADANTGNNRSCLTSVVKP